MDAYNAHIHIGMESMMKNCIFLGSNVTDLRERCSKAETAIYHKSINKRITRDEESNLKYLKSQNVHPFLNPMLHAALGDENNIYSYTTRYFAFVLRGINEVFGENNNHYNIHHQ